MLDEDWSNELVEGRCESIALDNRSVIKLQNLTYFFAGHSKLSNIEPCLLRPLTQAPLRPLYTD
jgi:hypothetical protein